MRVYRLTNLAIHLLAAVLLFLVVRRTLRMPALRDRFGPPFDVGKFDEAAAHFRAALEVTPTAALHTDLGAALEAAGRARRGDAHYRRALEIEPGYEPAPQNLGSALQAQGRGDEAVRHYRDLAQRSGTIASRVLLARSLAAQGRAGEAVAEYQAILSAPGRGASVAAQAHRELGDLLPSGHELDRARPLSAGART